MQSRCIIPVRPVRDKRAASRGTGSQEAASRGARASAGDDVKVEQLGVTRRNSA
ncbi:MAG: hypothetical protein WKG32_17890 [Gemmatimonadaceae bacterium]